MREPNVSLSIVCVFNEPSVRRACLDASLERLEAPEIEYVPVDNTRGQFKSAGQALMHGAERSTGETVVFAHQDVILHSGDALRHAATFLGKGPFGILGAIGVTDNGEYCGRMRDRVTLLGQHAVRPIEVDSLDEVLFIVRRSQLEREPLSTAPELAWHGYAVEYGLRVRRGGALVGAMSLNITHNSLTTNLARLEDAHQYIAGKYGGATQTTCGVVRGDGLHAPKRFASHRWRKRWASASLTAATLRSRSGVDRITLSDIRRDIDALLSAVGEPLPVINLDRYGTFNNGPQRPLRLKRIANELSVIALTMTEACEAVSKTLGQESTLITNLDVGQILLLCRVASGRPIRIGLDQDAGHWLLVGPAAHAQPAEWDRPSAKPFGGR